ncbi:unnamed protein product [Arctogadus glacialis]
MLCSCQDLAKAILKRWLMSRADLPVADLHGLPVAAKDVMRWSADPRETGKIGWARARYPHSLPHSPVPAVAQVLHPASSFTAAGGTSGDDSTSPPPPTTTIPVCTRV